MHSLKRIFFSLVISALPAASFAQEEIDRYFVELGPQDFYNSSGTRLTSGAAIFQQDRANFHRFGIQHGGDSSDRIFSNRDMRALIPELLARGSNPGFVQFVASLDPASAARPGYADYIIFVCGSNGRVTSMVLDNADGDSYLGC